MSQVFSLLSLAQAATSNILWGRFELINEDNLTRHRANLEKKILKLNLPTSISKCLKQGLSLLEVSNHHAFHWLKVYGERIPCLRYSKVSLHKGKYCLTRFMSPLGEFNDVNWVMQYVDDHKQDILNRFYFASIYCLEQKVKLLWTAIQNNHCAKDELFKYPDNPFTGIIRAWINFENERSVWDTHQNERFPSHYFKDYFRRSCELGYEKVVTYILSILSPSERNLYLGNQRSIQNTLYSAASNGHPKCVHAIYSYLSQEQQLQLLQRNYHILPDIPIWHYYLQPVLLRFVPDQISLHQHSLPKVIYTEFLCNLACKIKETKNTVYQELFDTVWKIGSVENKSYFLENGQDAFSALCIAMDFNSACCIIKEASLEQKRCFLIESIEQLWRNFAFRNNPLEIRNYLDIFVTDFQRVNAEMPFHADSLTLLKEIQLKCPNYSKFLNVVESLISEISSSVLVELSDLKI